MADFNKALNKTLASEGGYNPRDTNGFDAFAGINREHNGDAKLFQSIDSLKLKGASKETIERYVKEKHGDEIKSIYKDRYWSVLNLDSLSDQRLAEQAFDFSVTSGTSTAAKRLQKLAGVKQDGIIGDISSSAINSGGTNLLKSYARDRALFYNDLHKKNPDKFNNNINKSLQGRVAGSDTMFVSGDDITFGSDYQKLVDASHNHWAINEGKIANASAFERTKAMASNAIMTSSPYQIADWFQRQDFGFEEQSEWKSLVKNDDNVDSLLNSYGLDSSYYNVVKNTTSESHFLKLTSSIDDEKTKLNIINSTLGSSAKFVSSVAGAMLLSPENLLLPTMIPIKAARAISKAGIAYADAVKTSESLVKTLASTDGAIASYQAMELAKYSSAVSSAKKVAYASGATLATTVPAMRYITNDHYGLDDMALDAFLYGAVDIGFLGNQMKAGNVTNISRVNQIRSTFKEEREAFFNKIDDEATMAMAKDEATLNFYKEQLSNGKLAELRNNVTKVNDELITARNIYNKNKTEANLDRVNELRNSLSKSLSDISIAEKVISAGDKAEIHKWLDDVGVTAKNFVYPSTIDFLNGSIKKAKEIYPDLVRNLPDESVSADIINGLKKSGINTDELFKRGKVSAQVVIDKDGNAILKGTKSTSKISGKVPTAIALAILATEGTALADNGKGDSVFNIISLAAMAALGYLAWYRIKANATRNDMKFFDQAKESITSGYSSLTKDPTTGEFVGVPTVLSNTIDSIRTNFTETLKPLQDAGGKTKSIAEKLLRNAEDGGMFNAEQFKKMYTRRAMSHWDEEEKVLDEAYQQYLKDNNISNVDRLNNLLFDNVWKSDMRKKSSYCIKNPSRCKDKTAGYIASVFSKGMDDIANWLEDAGVDGFSRIKNYFPRMWQSQNLRVIIIKTGGEAGDGYKYIKDRLTKMLSAGGTPDDKIEAIVKERMDSIMSSDRVIRGKDNSEVLDDIFDRLKKRYELDEDIFEPFEVSIDGHKRVINIDDFFELDSKAVYEQYLNEASGHLALAKVGYKNYTKLFDEIQDVVPDLRHQSILNENVDLILGRSILDYSKDGVKVAMAVKNLSSAIMLPLAAVNMISEYTKLGLKTGANGTAIKMYLNKLSFGIIDHGLDSMFMKSIADFHGEGKDAIVQTMKFRGYFDPIHSSSMASHTAIDDAVVATGRLRDGVMLYNGMAKATDFGRIVSLNTNINILAKWLNNAHDIHPADMKVWGISDRTISSLKDKIQLNSKGNAKVFEPSTWDTATQDEYMKVINNMMQTDFQEHTLGGTGHYLRNTSVGMAFGALMGFPMQSIVTHAIRDAKGMAHGRLESYASSMIWFAGGYATYYTKALLQGKQPDEDKAIEYAVKMMPITSPFSLVQSAGDPVAAATVSNVLNAPMDSMKMFNDMVSPQ